jgi:hypothetical protein
MKQTQVVQGRNKCLHSRKSKFLFPRPKIYLRSKNLCCLQPHIQCTLYWSSEEKRRKCTILCDVTPYCPTECNQTIRGYPRRCSSSVQGKVIRGDSSNSHREFGLSSGAICPVHIAGCENEPRQEEHHCATSRLRGRGGGGGSDISTPGLQCMLASVNNLKNSADHILLTTWHPLTAKVATNFADKRRSLGILRSWTQDTEYVCLLYCGNHILSKGIFLFSMVLTINRDCFHSSANRMYFLLSCKKEVKLSS